MSKGDNRLKILYVIDELKQNSKTKSFDDPTRYLSASRLIEILDEKYGLSADRKSVYNYIESLTKYGFDIQKSRRGYYLCEHYDSSKSDEEFELAELKMIVDALASSRFISAQKTRTIIEKLRHLTSEGADSLRNRQVYLEKSVKSDNFSVIYSIDAIHSAIIQNKKIRFKYQKTIVNFDLPSGRLVSENKLGPDGEDKIYFQSPYALVWKNEYYYLICYDSETRSPKTFRVDRMKDVIVMEDQEREGGKYFGEISINEYANTAFSMYGGETINIVLKVNKELAGVIADRFGKDMSIYHDDDPHFFRCSVNVQKSNQFYSWLSGFGTDMELIFPKDIKDEYVSYLESLVSLYKKSANSAAE